MKVNSKKCERGFIDACGHFTSTAKAATYNAAGLTNSAVCFKGKTYQKWEWADEDTIEIKENSLISRPGASL